MSSLNPAALPFVPRQPLNPTAPRLVQPAEHSPAGPASCDAHLLTELPEELVTTVLGHLEDPKDAAACSQTCQRVHTAVLAAPLRLRMGAGRDGGADRLAESLGGVPVSFPGLVELDLSGCLAEDEGVHGLLARLPGLRVLRVSGCRKLSQAFVQGTFPLQIFSPSRTRPELQDLDQGSGPDSSQLGMNLGPGATKACMHYHSLPCQGGTQKSPQYAAAPIPSSHKIWNSEHPSRGFRTHLEAIDLQRCWQLNTRCLDHLLAHANTLGAHLRTLALSHLSLSDWPSAGLARADGYTSASTCHITSGPSVMDTDSVSSEITASILEQEHLVQGQHAAGIAESSEAMSEQQPGNSSSSSSNSSSSSIMTMAQSGSEQGFTLLQHGTGPCQHSPHQESQESEERLVLSVNGADPVLVSGTVVPGMGSGLCILALNNCVRLGPEGMRAIAASCPRLEHLFLGGTTIVTPHSSAAGAAPPSQPQSNPPAFPGMMAEGSPRASQVSALRSMMDAIRGIAPADSGGVHVQVAAELAAMVSSLPCLQTLELTFASAGILNALRLSTAVQEREGFRIWDFCSLDCLADVRWLLRTWDRGDAGPRAKQLHPDLAMAVAAAVNCSSRAKHTPLHLAAIEGCSQEAQELLVLGAALDPADRNGSTPLFLACEQGQAGTAALLLQAGACPCAQNRAEERPLYIASLRGHAAVVSELLRAMQSRGLPWQEPQGYSKGWAPLLAASLSDRLHVASILLDAAGGPGQRAAMVAAPNVYGQGSLHTAARRGNQPMLQLLLEHANSSALLARDKKGDSPISLARSAGHLQLAITLEARAHRHPAFDGLPQHVHISSLVGTAKPRRLPYHPDGMHGQRARKRNAAR